jgi:hypothetical protein
MEIYDQLFEGKLRGKVITDTIYSDHRDRDCIEFYFEDGTSIFIVSQGFFYTIQFEGEEQVKKDPDN